MLRVVALDILLFLLPFLLYAAYVLITRGDSNKGLWDDIPVLWLLAAGCALLVIAMVTLVSFSGGNTSATYHPSVLQDGVVKPGRID